MANSGISRFFLGAMKLYSRIFFDYSVRKVVHSFLTVAASNWVCQMDLKLTFMVVYLNRGTPM